MLALAIIHVIVVIVVISHSLLVLSLFSVFVVYDVNKFALHCEGAHCCEQGTVALWLDFANLFSGTLLAT